MVGAGQLARMTHQAAIPLGQSLRILADSADDGAALVAADVVVGDYRALEDLRAFARGWDAVRDAASLQAFGDRVGWPVVLKAATGGYDGKGVWVVTGTDAEVLGSGS